MVGWHHRLNGHEFEQALGEYWNGYEWQPDDYRIEIQPEYWQNLPLLPAEMMQDGE